MRIVSGALVVCVLSGCSSDDTAGKGGDAGSATGGTASETGGKSSGGSGAESGTFGAGGASGGAGGTRGGAGGTRGGAGGAAMGAGGATPATGGSSNGGASNGGTANGGASNGGTANGGTASGGASGSAGATLFVSPYKDTGIDMNWNTNVVSTKVSGSAKPLTDDLGANGAGAITLAFATGECGSENWAGVAGATIASVNVPLLVKAAVRYVVSTGGAAGVFSCASDTGFEAFVDRWMSSGLAGIDFDIEAGQTPTQIEDLIRRIQSAHTAYPALRYSLTLATLANNDGAKTAKSLGSGVQDSFNKHGDDTLAAVKSVLGFSGTAATWPAYLTVNLMTMDYGSPGSGVCVVDAGACDMGESAIQAAYNLHDRWGVPYANVELTPMIGGNDVSGEKFTLDDVTTVIAFARSQHLAGVHYWSYDRDRDCPVQSASSTCNTMGDGYAGTMGYLKAFLAAP